MKRILLSLFSLALVVPALLLGIGPPPAQATTSPAAEGDPSLMLLLDSSGSMAEPAAGGTTKIAAAKDALNRVVDELPADAQVGMRVYGSEVYEEDAPGACTDTELVVPIGVQNRPRLRKAIGRYQPYGSTPIAYSLQQAAADLGKTGQRSIVLVSDGEETCDPDPCATAAAIEGAGIDLIVNVVGLQVDGTAREQLQCIAEAGGGTYYDAGSADELLDGLSELALQAVQPLELDGTPVTGSPDAASAPELAADGTYTDTLTTAARTYYSVPVEPGNTLLAGVLVKLGRGNANLYTRSSMSIAIRPAGTDLDCGTAVTTDVGDSASNPLITMAADSYQDDEACLTADRFDVVVHDVSQALVGQRFRLQLATDAPVTNLEELPEAGEPTWQTKPSPNPTPVSPGTSLPTAAPVEPGSHTFEMVPGEVRFFAVDADWGQAVQARVEPGPIVEGVEANAVTLGLLGPQGGDAAFLTAESEPDDSYGSSAAYADDLLLTRTTPTIRYLNRDTVSQEDSGASLPGTYYIAVTMTSDFAREGLVVPMELTVGTPGTPGEGAPEYAETATDEEPSPTPNDGTSSPASPSSEVAPSASSSDDPQVEATSSQTDDDKPWVLVALLVGLAVLIGGGATGLLVSTRGRRP